MHGRGRSINWEWVRPTQALVFGERKQPSGYTRCQLMTTSYVLWHPGFPITRWQTMRQLDILSNAFPRSQKPKSVCRNGIPRNPTIKSKAMRTGKSGKPKQNSF